MNDIDWERTAATIGLCVITNIATIVLCNFIGIPDPYRQGLATGISFGLAVAFYERRKNKTRDGVPIED